MILCPGWVTSDVVSDTGPETASPGDEDPLKDLSIYTARFHHDDWSRGSRKRSDLIVFLPSYLSHCISLMQHLILSHLATSHLLYAHHISYFSHAILSHLSRWEKDTSMDNRKCKPMKLEGKQSHLFSWNSLTWLRNIQATVSEWHALPLVVQPVLSGGSRSTRTSDLPENHKKVKASTRASHQSRKAKAT